MAISDYWDSHMGSLSRYQAEMLAQTEAQGRELERLMARQREQQLHEERKHRSERARRYFDSVYPQYAGDVAAIDALTQKYDDDRLKPEEVIDMAVSEFSNMKYGRHEPPVQAVMDKVTFEPEYEKPRKPKGYREELQAEADEWLEDVA